MDSLHWNNLLASFPNQHILQTDQWGDLKSRFGWKPDRNVWQYNGEVFAAALILERKLPVWGLSKYLRVLYVPKGPCISDWADDELRIKVLNELKDYAKSKKAVFIKIDPDVAVFSAESTKPDQTLMDPTGQSFIKDLKDCGWIYSNEQIQFRNTVLIDLTYPEDELLANMKQKTRYNIRLAQRKGVTVRVGSASDLPMLYDMYQETASRDNFIIRPSNYYLENWKKFLQGDVSQNCINDINPEGVSTSSGDKGCLNIPLAEPLIAEFDGVPIAAVIYYRFGKKAWFFYGMSRNIHRDKMPNYLLQWEAIKRAKQVGCQWIDLWGAPEVFDDRDPLFGVYRFKAGFGGSYIRYCGAWDLPLNKIAYRLYTHVLPRFLDMLRFRYRQKSKIMMKMKDI